MSTAKDSVSTPRVVIVGGGFAGLNAAKELRKSSMALTVIDKRNHHLFQPLLYQVATALLSPSDIAQPIRAILHKAKNTRVVMEEVTALDLEKQEVVTENGRVPYDYLMLAAGATHSYFGNDQWEPMAPGLKTIENALDIRSRVLRAFEEAEIAVDPVEQQAWLTFVIVGGGPTGVELAGAIAEIARKTMRGEFRRIDPARARIVLVEALDRVLPPFDPELSKKAERQLQELGVECRFGNPVKVIEPGRVVIGEESLPCETVMWAAGVKASPIGAMLGVPLDRAGRVLVEPDLSIPGYPNVFVAGDLASIKVDEKPVPGVAPAAVQMGRHVAGNLKRLATSGTTTPFIYKDKGSLAIIGRNKAVAQIGNMKLTGFVAWLLWLVVHLGYLNGYRNRIIAALDWAVMYVTHDRGSRLVSGYPGSDRMARGEGDPAARA